MDIKDIQKAADSSRRLIQDDIYYKYIFKKTERIVSVIFYVLNSVPETKKSQTHIEDIQHAARALHDAILQSLETRAYAAEDVVRGVAHALVSLESKLTVAQVAGVLPVATKEVFSAEIDTVLRGMNKYIQHESEGAFFADSPKDVVTPPAQAQPKAERASSSKSSTSTSSTASRRLRIAEILEAKGEASIKDIADNFTDVSEKTIQRELNLMIEDNLVKRQGERRWSRYSLF